MRVIVRTEELRFPIPVLIPSVLIFNHITAVIGLLVLMMMSLLGRVPWRVTAASFGIFHRLIFIYWNCRLRNPNWKLVEIKSKDACITIKL